MPTTMLGKLSVGLNALFLISVTVSVFLVEGLKVLSFDDHWWDATVAVSFPASIIALIIGIIAVRKYRERSYWVYLSILIGVCLVLFIITHSLYIND